MDLTQLRYFLTVVECSSFTLAAKQCNVTQPALSQQIAKLEREFGCSLFNRMGRHVTLTPLGQTLRDRAMTILNCVEDTRRQMLDDGRFGVINFAVAPVIGQYLSARILQAAAQEFQECELNFSELPIVEIVRRIKSGEVDVALVPDVICSDREIELEQIFEEELKLMINREHRLAAERQIDLSALNGEKICLLNDTHHYSSGILDVFDSQRIKIGKTIQVDSFSMMSYLVSLNEGIGFLPSSSVPPAETNKLVYRSLAGTPIQRRIALCWNRRRYMTQLLGNFIKAIRHFSLPELNPILPNHQPEGTDGRGVLKSPPARK